MTTETVTTRHFTVQPFDGPQDTEPYAVYPRGSSSAAATGTLAWCNAEALRLSAAEHEAEAAESFDRCDTDGFLSQWASQQMSALERTSARIAEVGGVWTFSRLQLVTTDGEATDARLVETKFGPKWRLDSTDQWLPVSPKRESTLGKHGYRELELREVAPAKAIHWAPPGARGLSGASMVQVVIVRTDGAKGWRPAGAPEAA